MRSLRLGVGVVGILLGAFACGTDKPDCGCVAEEAGERRSIVCGASACIAGRLEICDENAVLTERGACTANGGSTNAQAGTSGAEPPMMIETHYCDDLRTYCTSSCAAPPTPSANCQATAASGDESACQNWPLTSGILCRP